MSPLLLNTNQENQIISFPKGLVVVWLLWLVWLE